MNIQPLPRRNASNADAHTWGRLYVYVLWCPLAKQIKYVGYSSQPPHMRLSGHLSEARSLASRHRPKSQWIYTLLERGASPVLRVVKYCESLYGALVCEAELIESVGARRALLNGNKGEIGLIASYKSQSI